MSGKVLTYNNKPIDIKLTYNIRFKLVSMGLTIASALITEGASIVDFCKAWSLFLSEPFDTNSKSIEEETERFLAGFSVLEAVNPYYLLVLKRDGLYSVEEDENKDKKKTVKKKAS